MVRQAGMVNSTDFGMLLQCLGQRYGIFILPADPHWHCCNAAGEHPGRDRVQATAQQQLTGLDLLDQRPAARDGTPGKIAVAAKYLVKEWSTRSAPCARGLMRNGVENVESTTNRAP